MIIKITEKGDVWDLWVTEKTGGTETMTYAASNRSIQQIEALLPAITAKESSRAPRGSDLARLKRETLGIMLTILDGWIECAQQNHDSMERGSEEIGKECWRRFSPDDIRRMVRDTAEWVGIADFPVPATGPEDRERR